MYNRPTYIGNYSNDIKLICITTVSISYREESRTKWKLILPSSFHAPSIWYDAVMTPQESLVKRCRVTFDQLHCFLPFLLGLSQAARQGLAVTRLVLKHETSSLRVTILYQLISQLAWVITLERSPACTIDSGPISGRDTRTGGGNIYGFCDFYALYFNRAKQPIYVTTFIWYD